MPLKTSLDTDATDFYPSVDLSEVDFTRNADYLKLNAECVRECGIEAAITLAAFYRRTGKKKNFECLSQIAALTGVNVRTAKRHFTKLEENGWVENIGKQRRRTATRFIPPRTISKLQSNDPWSMELPVWSLMLDIKPSDLALLAIAFHRVKGLMNPSDGSWDCVNVDYDEYEWTIKHVSTLTGMDRKTIRAARNRLVKQGLVADEHQPEGKVKLAPQTYHDDPGSVDDVFATASYFDGRKTKHVGLLGEICPLRLGNLSLEVGKSVPSLDLKDLLSERPEDTKSGSARTVCEISTSSTEEKKKPTKHKRPLWSKLILLSGRKPSRCNSSEWKLSVDVLEKNGKTHQQIERVFLYAVNRDKWFSAVDRNRDFPVRHFMRNFSKLERKSIQDARGLDTSILSRPMGIPCWHT